MRKLTLPLLVLSLWLGHASAQPLEEPGVHVVSAGQRLESIARRYSVSVDAICSASGIPRSAKLRVGQRLVIPARGDADGSEARAARESGQLEPRATQEEDPSSENAVTDSRRGQREERRAPPQGRAAAEGAVTAQAIHRVRPGQTLGGIAQRYGVTVEALRAANRLGAKQPLRVGQELLVPALSSAGAAPARRPTTAPAVEGRPSELRSPRDPVIHKVAPGHTLGKLAKRYQVSVEEICAANEIDRRTPLKLGQRLVIPPPGGGDSAAVRRVHATLNAEARAEESQGTLRPRPARQSTRLRARTWREYAERPARPGRVTLIGYNERWTGFVTAKGGKVLPQAVQEVSRVMGAVGKKPRADARLLKLIAKVSDTFGGRPIRVVSGYRRESYFQDSRHRTSQALDFSIPGVPNEAIRDYLRTLDDVGVGYYPNSSFVHMDARNLKTYWVDYSGPGEAPRRSARAASAKPEASPEAERDLPETGRPEAERPEVGRDLPDGSPGAETAGLAGRSSPAASDQGAHEGTDGSPAVATGAPVAEAVDSPLAPAREPVRRSRSGR